MYVEKFSKSWFFGSKIAMCCSKMAEKRDFDLHIGYFWHEKSTFRKFLNIQIFTPPKCLHTKNQLNRICRTWDLMYLSCFQNSVLQAFEAPGAVFTKNWSIMPKYFPKSGNLAGFWGFISFSTWKNMKNHRKTASNCIYCENFDNSSCFEPHFYRGNYIGKDAIFVIPGRT